MIEVKPSELILETQCLWFEPYRLQQMLNSIGALSAGVTDHGALTGLGDDDHPQYLLRTDYTAADVLTKIKTVDGVGSGLDADLLDGNSSAYFLAASSYTAADVLSKLLTVDGSGSGLDADLLDGHDTSYFATATHTHVGQGLWSISGTLTVATGAIRIYNRFGATKTISEVYIAVSTAPTGASIIVDVNKNGTTIFTTQANRPTITATNFTGSSTSIDVTSFGTTDYLTVDVDQIGSTVAGANLTVHVVYS